MMSLHLPNGTKKRVPSGDVRAEYVGAFANRGVTLLFANVALERFNRKEEEFFAILSLEAQDSVLDATCPARSWVAIPDVDVACDVIIAVLDVDSHWDLKGTVGVDEFNKESVKRRVPKLQ